MAQNFGSSLDPKISCRPSCRRAARSIICAMARVVTLGLNGALRWNNLRESASCSEFVDKLWSACGTRNNLRFGASYSECINSFLRTYGNRSESVGISYGQSRSLKISRRQS
jgi:hypothetical protein